MPRKGGGLAVKVTAQDVARLARVSRATVSLVLTGNATVSISEQTRARVLEAAKTLRYGPFDRTRFPPRPAAYAAVFVPTMANPYYPETLHVVGDLLFQQGYKTLYFCTDKSLDKERQFLRSLDPEDTRMLLYAYTPQEKDLLRKLSESVPVCVLGELNFKLDCIHVALNSFNAGYEVMRHLWEQGHRRICFVSNPVQALSISRQRRMEGILAFGREMGMEGLILKTAESSEELDEYDAGYALTKRALREDGNITAVVGVNDVTAIGAVHAILEEGLKIPEDLAVVGFDNSALAQHYNPALTSVDHHLYDRAKLAISTVLDESRAFQAQRIVYEPSLIVRASSAYRRG